MQLDQARCRAAALANENARRWPSSSTMLMYWPAMKATRSPSGSAMRTGASRRRQMRSMALDASVPATQPPRAALSVGHTRPRSPRPPAPLRSTSAPGRARASRRSAPPAGRGRDRPAVEHRAHAQAAAAGAAVVGQRQAGAQAGLQQGLAGARADAAAHPDARVSCSSARWPHAAAAARAAPAAPRSRRRPGPTRRPAARRTPAGRARAGTSRATARSAPSARFGRAALADHRLHDSASTSSIASTASAIGRGGCVCAFGTRCTCTHITSSATSGTPMWMKTSSENRRSLTLAGQMKLRISVPPKPGSQSSHSKLACVTNCASRSHGSM